MTAAAPLRLILIRHAKSGWDDLTLDDHDRPLTDRGRDNAPRIGRWLAAQGYVPTQVLCSDATRTRQTLALILPELPTPPQVQVQYMSTLYHASAGQMLAELHKATEPVVAMIGHNPGIGTFANGVVQGRPGHPRYRDYPTAATAVIDFDLTGWAQVRPRLGRVTDFTIPHDLAD